MAKKLHLSRLASPKSWLINKKSTKWVAKPCPGAHSQETALPLVVLVRDLLGIVKTSKGVKHLINEGELLVNQSVPKSIKLPVGLFDTVSIPKLKKQFKILFSKSGKLFAQEISADEAKILPLKIKNKKTLSGGKTQLNFSNGWNLRMDKVNYKVNDIIKLNLDNHKIQKHLKLEKGKNVYVTGGKKIGRSGILKDIKNVGLLKKDRIATIESNGKTWETKLEYLFVEN